MRTANARPHSLNGPSRSICIRICGEIHLRTRVKQRTRRLCDLHLETRQRQSGFASESVPNKFNSHCCVAGTLRLALRTNKATRPPSAEYIEKSAIRHEISESFRPVDDADADDNNWKPLNYSHQISTTRIACPSDNI